MGLADSVQMILRPKDLEKASDLFQIDLALLERLNSQRLLNTIYIRNLLVKADYERLTSGLHWLEHENKNYKFPEVQRALKREYRLTDMELKSILVGRQDALFFCKRCGTRVTRKTFTRTAGMCPDCFAETIEL